MSFGHKAEAKDMELVTTWFRPLGEFLCLRRQRNQNAAGGVHAQFHCASSHAPRPPVTGDALLFFWQLLSAREAS